MANENEKIIKRGRPKVDGSRKVRYTIRLDEDEDAMLSHLEVESDETKADIMRKALRTYYKMESTKW